MKDKTMKLDLQMFATDSTQNQNTTGASGMSAEMKTFYEKRLIDQAEPALVHDQFGDPYPIPANGGKNIDIASDPNGKFLLDLGTSNGSITVRDSASSDD